MKFVFLWHTVTGKNIKGVVKDVKIQENIDGKVSFQERYGTTTTNPKEGAVINLSFLIV